MIKGQFWSADGDGDERLTAAEAARAGFVLIKPSGGVEQHPLGIRASDVAAADADHDGRLSPDEYVPLGIAKTLAYLAAHPALIGRFFLEAKPWSH
jgi:hypothetical protein